MRTCVLYIASFSGRYNEDAIVSRDSVKAHNPNLPCILATEKWSGLNGWDRILRMSPLRYQSDMWYLDSTRWANEAFDILYNDYDAILILDTDTFCAAPLDDMFVLADRFDVCGSHGVSRQTTGAVSNVPISFPEVEIGALLVQTNERVRSLFVDWLELYEAHPEVYGNNDQGPLRDAIWMNKYINFFALPEEYHCRWGFGVCVVSTVRILHGRSPGYPNSKAAQEINSTVDVDYSVLAACGGDR